MRSFSVIGLSVLLVGCNTGSNQGAGDAFGGDSKNRGDPQQGDCPIVCTSDDEEEVVTCTTFANSDEAILVRMGRHTPSGICAGGCPFEATGLSVATPEGSDCILDPSSLMYNKTHHNWNDSLNGCTPDSCYLLEMIYDWMVDPPVWHDSIIATDASTTEVLWGPFPLTRVLP
ncbi:hypothetical protein ACFL6C_13895 [Myxococcota bacterium]